MIRRLIASARLRWRLFRSRRYITREYGESCRSGETGGGGP